MNKTKPRSNLLDKNKVYRPKLAPASLEDQRKILTNEIENHHIMLLEKIFPAGEDFRSEFYVLFLVLWAILSFVWFQNYWKFYETQDNALHRIITGSLVLKHLILLLKYLSVINGFKTTMVNLLMDGQPLEIAWAILTWILYSIAIVIGLLVSRGFCVIDMKKLDLSELRAGVFLIGVFTASSVLIATFPRNTYHALHLCLYILVRYSSFSSLRDTRGFGEFYH